MIRSVKMAKEIVVVSQNKVGTLGAVAAILADRGVNIIALSAQAAGGVALMNFVTDDNLRAKDLLRKKGYSFQENDVLMLEVEDKPGVLSRITKKLRAKKVNILNVYGSAPTSYGPCALVVSTDHNQKAFVALRA